MPVKTSDFQSFARWRKVSTWPDQSSASTPSTPAASAPDSNFHQPFHPGCLLEEKPALIGEMDFFSIEKNPRPAADLDLKIKKEEPIINTALHLASAGSDHSTVDEGLSPKQRKKKKSEVISNYLLANDLNSPAWLLIRCGIQLAEMQAELGRMTEENQKLKGMLSQVTNNYNALQMQLVALMQSRNQLNQEVLVDGSKKQANIAAIVPRQFIDLGPGADADDASTHSSTDDEQSTHGGGADHGMQMSCDDHGGDGRGFSGEESPENSSHGWNPNKQSKVGGVGPKPGDQVQEATMRKARVSVRARSEAPMITDGCHWRKYGQKMAKGNPCPRAYYRCTMATGCPVRKQVQRCAEDRTILITTYEGNHNHPLPPAAMAMASTTSAAASMLLSGSMPSADGLMNSNFLARTILPCSSSMATISASAPFPTVTLDLTHPPTLFISNAHHRRRRSLAPPYRNRPRCRMSSANLCTTNRNSPVCTHLHLHLQRLHSFLSQLTARCPHPISPIRLPPPRQRLRRTPNSPPRLPLPSPPSSAVRTNREAAIT
ncbi:hypothetical protein HPP92_003914 [Vanilla planifolia]|uniref:WRKY domain-containing protein n=1 Tax=Vanilla planifolia TaxID=51239 RepID=A0A835VJE3_VANPL|nr:hypothetical protein HPP92_003914 [Vanilla planifolia]